MLSLDSHFFWAKLLHNPQRPLYSPSRSAGLKKMHELGGSSEITRGFAEIEFGSMDIDSNERAYLYAHVVPLTASLLKG